MATVGERRARVRYNREYFGYIVGFPDGDIVLAGPSAESVISDVCTKEELQPHLLPTLQVREGFFLHTPPLIWLELTRKCNLACPHCYISAGHRRADEMTTQRWHSLIDEIADAGVWAVAFTGGEPTLHRDFIGLVTHARERDLLVGIATHGMFLSKSMLDALPREGVIISVSIDDLHVDHKGENSPTTAAMDAIVRAQQHGFLTNVMTNTHRENIHALGSIMDWAAEHRVSVRSVPFSPIGRGKFRRDLENVADDVESAAQFWLRECEWEHEYHRQAGLCVGSIFNYGLSLAYMTRRCSSARYLCYIAADGLMFPCTMCASEDLFPGGSVAETPFADVWRAEWSIRNLSWDNFADTCDGCVINDPKYYCASRCPAMSFARNGTYFGCGASEFEILSTIRRTEMLVASETGAGSNLPLVPLVTN